MTTKYLKFDETLYKENINKIKVETSSGDEVEIKGFDGDIDCPIYGIIKYEDNRRVLCSWDKNGICSQNYLRNLYLVVYIPLPNEIVVSNKNGYIFKVSSVYDSKIECSFMVDNNKELRTGQTIILKDEKYGDLFYDFRKADTNEENLLNTKINQFNKDYRLISVYRDELMEIIKGICPFYNHCMHKCDEKCKYLEEIENKIEHIRRIV